LKDSEPDTISQLLKASLTRVVDYAVFSYTTMKPVFSCHGLGGLRSIPEDLIVLTLLVGLKRADRNKLCNGLLGLEVQENLDAQSVFFQSFMLARMC